MKSVYQKILFYWLPLAVWLFVIFLFSSLPGIKTGFPHLIDLILRKSAHVVIYLVLSWLILRALRSGRKKKLTKKQLLLAFIFCFLYAVSDEWHQTFVPFREGVWTDVGFDSVGAFLGLKLFSYNLKRFKK